RFNGRAKLCSKEMIVVGSASIFFSSRMSPASLTIQTLTVSRDTSRPVKEPAADARDIRPGAVARLLHLCRLGLNCAVPDHSTFSKNRHGRFRDSDLLRKVFETTVRRCLAEGLIGGEGFAVDASMIKADANRQRSVPGSEWRAPEAA